MKKADFDACVGVAKGEKDRSVEWRGGQTRDC